MILISDVMKVQRAMMDRKDFEVWALDRLSELGDITSRPMFGHGVYWRDVIFGIIFGDRLYFKVSDESKGEYLATTDRLIVTFGKTWRVDDLAADDLEALRVGCSRAAAAHGCLPTTYPLSPK